MLDPRSPKWNWRIGGSLLLSILLVPSYWFWTIGGCGLGPEAGWLWYRLLAFLCTTPGVIAYIVVVAFFPFWLTLLLLRRAKREPRESDQDFERWNG